MGSTGAEVEAPVLWPPDVKSQPTEKDYDAGRNWGQEEKGATENEMVGQYYGHSGHEFKQTLGDGEGQGSLASCSPWDHRVGHDLAAEQQEILFDLWDT